MLGYQVLKSGLELFPLSFLLQPIRNGNSLFTSNAFFSPCLDRTLKARSRTPRLALVECPDRFPTSEVKTGNPTLSLAGYTYQVIYFT